MGKKKPRERKDSKRYEKYKIEGKKIIRPRFCPRCGPGVILAISKDRIHCGKCHYTEFLGQKAQNQKEEKVSKEKSKK